jgi:serine/threonine protein kinase/WD40 repeat protein
LQQEVETLLASSDDVRSNFLKSSPALHVTLPAGTKLGEYEVKSLLGSGGMGEVYRARDSRLGRDVAIKILPSSLSADPERLRRFEQEARAAATLNHPNILAVFQMGTYEGAPYMVSELLEGESLRDQIKRGRLSVRKAIDYGVQIAHGLAAAHEKEIIHRDLKPENLFVTKDGRVKILDFGLAKLAQPQSSSNHSAPTFTEGTEAGVVMGTVGYMSPEQVRGQTADHRADIFSFGAILYEMLAGKRAFQKATSADTQSAILNEDPPEVSKSVPDVSPSMQRVVHRCLEKNQEQRFQSASDLAFALDAVSETSGNAGVVSNKRLRSRSKLWAMAAVAGVVLVASGVGWVFWKRKPADGGPIVQRQLTASTADNPITEAAISRDGKYLAYSDRDGISIQEIEGGDVHKLSGTVGLEVQDWYPDGLHLLVTDGENDLWTLFAFSGERHKLVSGVGKAYISPDGSQMLLLRHLNASELWTLPATGGEPQVRASAGQDEELMSAGWSPDGKAIADIRVSEGWKAGTLEIRDLQNGKVHTLLTDRAWLGGGETTITWLPDGRILFGLFKDTSISESDLWTIPLDSSHAPVGKPVRITNTTGFFIGDTSVSRDGKRLAIAMAQEPFSIFVAGLSKPGDRLEKPVRLTNDSWHNRPRAWSPDGKTLFYDSARKGRAIYQHSISTGATELFSGGTDQHGPTSISPDGMWLMVVVNQRDSEKRRLLRIPLSGGAPETILTPAGEAAIQCAFSGSRICLLSEVVGKQEIFSTVDPVRGRLEEKTRMEGENLAAWSLSPDGTRIAVVENVTDSVRLVDLTSKKIQVIHPSPPQAGLQEPAWSWDGQRLFISSFPGNKGRLLQMDLAGHSSPMLENPYGWIGGPLPSPDGKRLAYIYAFKECNVTLLENF